MSRRRKKKYPPILQQDPDATPEAVARALLRHRRSPNEPLQDEGAGRMVREKPEEAEE